MGVSENSGFSPQIIQFNRVFMGFPLFSPSILGVSLFSETSKWVGLFFFHGFFTGEDF